MNKSNDLSMLAGRIAVILLSILSISSSFASASDHDQAELLIKKYLITPKTITADFVQYINDDRNNVMDTMKGKILIQKPNNFSWHYTSPYEQIFIGDGINFISYDIDLDHLIRKKQSELNLMVPLILMQGGQRIFDDIEYIEIHKEQNQFWVKLRYSDTNNDLFEFTLGFSNEILSKMILNDSLGQIMIINFEGIALDKEINSDAFDINLFIQKNNLVNR